MWRIDMMDFCRTGKCIFFFLVPLWEFSLRFSFFLGFNILLPLPWTIFFSPLPVVFSFRFSCVCSFHARMEVTRWSIVTDGQLSCDDISRDCRSLRWQKKKKNIFFFILPSLIRREERRRQQLCWPRKIVTGKMYVFCTIRDPRIFRWKCCH